MENNHNHENENWLDEILGTAAPAEEIGPDEQAVYSAGLTHPNDLELEQILSEDWSADVAYEAALREGSIKEEPVPEQPENEKKVPEKKAEPVRKGRPKKKGGYGLFGIPHLLATCIWLAIILAVGISLGRTIWVCCADLMAFGKEQQQVTITITDSDTIDTVSEKLGKANLVRYPGLFKFFAEITGKEANISAGTFTLNSLLDYNAMINAMTYYGASREVVEIMFPEGYNCAQIFRLLEKNNVCTARELEDWAANGELSDYWFLDGVERGSKYCLEGYLAPDTYEFYTNDEPQRVLEKFLNEFDDRFTDIMRENFETMQYNYALRLSERGYSSDYIEENKLTLHKVVTLASIVQKETSSNSECYKIASVFYNRLVSANFPFLDSDATVYYAIGDYFGEKEELSQADIDSSSPYNTRNHQGLPPGPICNPGAYAMYSALEPDDTGYYYFVYDEKAREHIFNETYDGHMRTLAELGLS